MTLLEGAPRSHRVTFPLGILGILVAMTACAAKWTACCAEPHCRSTVVPGTVSGKPAARAALRPMFIACSPTVIVQP